MLYNVGDLWMIRKTFRYRSSTLGGANVASVRSVKPGSLLTGVSMWFYESTGITSLLQVVGGVLDGDGFTPTLAEMAENGIVLFDTFRRHQGSGTGAAFETQKRSFHWSGERIILKDKITLGLRHLNGTVTHLLLIADIKEIEGG